MDPSQGGTTRTRGGAGQKPTQRGKQGQGPGYRVTPCCPRSHLLCKTQGSQTLNQQHPQPPKALLHLPHLCLLSTSSVPTSLGPACQRVGTAPISRQQPLAEQTTHPMEPQTRGCSFVENGVCPALQVAHPSLEPLVASDPHSL